MSNTAEQIQFADYCGIPVIVLDEETTRYGTLALIQYEDGREEQVPLVKLNLL